MRSAPTVVIICGTDKSVPYTQFVEQLLKLQFYTEFRRGRKRILKCLCDKVTIGAYLPIDKVGNRC